MIISTLFGQIGRTEKKIKSPNSVLSFGEINRRQKGVHVRYRGGMDINYVKTAHVVLDCVGLVPIFGKTANLVNAGWYAVEGDYKNAGLSVLSAVPGIGKAAKATKFGLKGIDAAIALTNPTRGYRKFSR